MKTRFTITCEKNGNRVMAFRNIAANLYDTREQAEKVHAAYLASSWKNMALHCPHSRVDSVECYDHGEAVRTVFS